LTRPPCFNGFTQTINGILLLFEEEKINGMPFLITNRLNQDVLENLFSIFRQKGGYNKNPTARTLRTSFRSNCIFSLCTSKATNCETKTYELEQFEENQLENINITDLPPDNLSISSSSTTSSTKSLTSQVLSQHETITLEDCSVVYFAGYLVKKCIAKFNCSYCISHLMTNKNIDDQKQFFLLFKNYTMYETGNSSGLKAPSNYFNQIINKALSIFESKIENILYKRKLILKLINILKKIMI